MFDIFRDHFAKQIASASDRSNRKSSTIMTAHFLDGKVVTAGEATKVVSPPPSKTYLLLLVSFEVYVVQYSYLECSAYILAYVNYFE